MRRVMLALAGAGAVLAIGAPVASAAPCDYAFSDLHFLNRQKAQTVGSHEGTLVYGTVGHADSTYQCVHQDPNSSVTMYEYVKVSASPEQYVLYDTSTVAMQSLSGGPFAFHIDPGPSRRIRFQHYSDFGPFWSESLELTGVSRVTLGVSDDHVRNREQVTFTGALPGPFLGGLPTIALQVRVGKKWRTFKALAISPDGTFTAIYRFTATTRKQTYVFRAKPLAEAVTYPYATSASTKAKVTVKP